MLKLHNMSTKIRKSLDVFKYQREMFIIYQSLQMQDYPHNLNTKYTGTHSLNYMQNINIELTLSMKL